MEPSAHDRGTIVLSDVTPGFLVGATALTSANDHKPQIIRREGEFWTVEFAGGVTRMRDTVGVRYLAYLLIRPNLEVSSLDIYIAGSRGAAPAGDDGAAGDGQAAERARINVTRALKGVLGRIALHSPGLSDHLHATLRTGSCCSYRPDPRLAVDWQYSGD